MWFCVYISRFICLIIKQELLPINLGMEQQATYLCTTNTKCLLGAVPLKPCSVLQNKKEALFQVRQKGLRASLTSFQFCIYKNVAC